MQNFINFIADIMGVDPSELSEDTAYGHHEKWDSLMHIRLIMEIEEKYNIEIPIDEVPDIKTIKQLYQCTQQYEAL